MTAFILFGSKKIDFTLDYSSRKTLGITVMPNLKVLVKAPMDAPLDKIREKVKKRAPWILKQQRFFLSFYPKLTERNYVTGETHLYLGKQYRLNIIESAIESVKLKGKFIEVHTTDKANVEQLVNAWYIQHARSKFLELAKPIIERFQKYDVSPSEIVLRNMPSRWGSCTPTGKILLNPKLIQAPTGCIEYVITHELCHLIHHDHTKKFFDLQTSEMQDWEKWKGKLEQLLA